MYSAAAIILAREVAQTYAGEGHAARGTGIYVTPQEESARSFSVAAAPWGEGLYVKVVVACSPHIGEETEDAAERLDRTGVQAR